jgi:hypothetical protein
MHLLRRANAQKDRKSGGRMAMASRDSSQEVVNLPAGQQDNSRGAKFGACWARPAGSNAWQPVHDSRQQAQDSWVIVERAGDWVGQP